MFRQTHVGQEDVKEASSLAGREQVAIHEAGQPPVSSARGPVETSPNSAEV